jgi:His-Xaa-Ser system protein HxsD
LSDSGPGGASLAGQPSTDAQAVPIRIDLRAYSLEVVQRAAFKCTDVASFAFSLGGDHDLDVIATVNPGMNVDPAALTARFQNEVLDQKLRQTIADETKSERDLILAYAFSNTKLLE